MQPPGGQLTPLRGIHFEQGDLDGREAGRRIGAQAWDRAQAYFRGRG